MKASQELGYRTLGVVLDPGAPSERRVEFCEVGLDVEELVRGIGRVHEGDIEFLGPVSHGTYPAWRPDALGGEAAIVSPPASPTAAPPETAAAEPESAGPAAHRHINVNRLRGAALASSCLRTPRVDPVLRLAFVSKPGPYPFAMARAA